MLKFRFDISARFSDIAEEQVPAKLKPIEVPFRGQNGIGKVSARPSNYFDVVGSNVAPLGQPQSAVQNLTR